MSATMEEAIKRTVEDQITKRQQVGYSEAREACVPQYSTCLKKYYCILSINAGWTCSLLGI